MCGSGVGMLLLGKIQRSIRRTYHPR